MLKRLFDILFSFIGLIILSPVFFIVGILIKLDSKGPVFYRQVRTGKDNKPFKLFKFRSMYTNSDKVGQLTVGMRDSRITKMGYSIRKYKLDELPQLINVFLGEMSLVGPRPEVPKYTLLYNQQQLKVLSVKPGITDPASIAYSKENDLLESALDPERMYINEIMPAKLALNLQYIESQSFWGDIKIIFNTLSAIVK